MKRLSYLITTETITIDLCKAAILEAATGKMKRRSVAKVIQHIGDAAAELRNIALTGNYVPSPYKVCHIVDKPSGKARILHKPKFYPDQCMHHLLIRLIRSKLLSYFDKYCLSGIRGRGIHYGHRILQRWIREHRPETAYCLKGDVRKCYDSIKPEIAMQAMERIVKDPAYLHLTSIVLHSHPSLPLGNYTSGWYANLVLTKLDRAMLSHTPYYLRYADDFVVFSDNKPFLHTMRKLVEQTLNSLSLTLKPNYQIFPVAVRGVDMLGYRYYPAHTLRRKRNSLRMMKAVRRYWKRPTAKNEQRAKSHLGQCKWFNSRNFCKVYYL